MAGHSKWSNIKRTKGAKDAKRSADFHKVSRDIENAAKLSGVSNPSESPMLKVATDRAKSLNMPADRIQKAINKGLGIKSAEDDLNLEVSYELFGPKGAMFIVDCVTDNNNRTVTDIKTFASKNPQFKLASPNSIIWQFREVGIVEFDQKDGYEEKVLTIPGIEDIDERKGSIRLLVDKENFSNVVSLLTNDFTVSSAELAKVANNEIEISPEEVEELQELLALLRDAVPDVVTIWSNLANFNE